MNDMTLGQRIAQQRKLKNMSQEALAAQLDISRQAISKWESDGTVPELDKLIALGKLFGVSVGWLLGTERHPSPQVPVNEGLTQAQLKEVEELVARNSPIPRRSPRVLLYSLLILSLLALAGIGFLQINAENRSAQELLEQLRAENEALSARLEEMDTQLKDLARSDRLLESMYGDCELLGDNMASVTFFFTPKIYQESAQAFLSIKNVENRVFRYPCTWNGEAYTVEAELRLDGGYVYSFLLVTDGSFREQSLMDPDFYNISPLADIYTNCHFHLDPAGTQFAMMTHEEFHWLDPNLERYSFRENLFSPKHFPEDGRGYQEILLVLKLNGSILWQESILDAYLLHSGGHPISNQPFPLDLSIPLPELHYGDKLQLYVIATLSNGQTLETLLDERFSWERPEENASSNS